MAITTLAQVKAARPGQWVSIAKPNTAESVGAEWSFWKTAGNPPAGVDPSSGLAGDIPTSATLGAIPFVNPASGLTYIGGFSAMTHRAGMLYVYDRLWHNSGISSTLLTAQTINSVALTRPDANGTMAEVWWQVYTVMGAGTPTVTLVYTNPAGTASRAASSGALPTTLAAGRTGQFTLDVGDIGVKSVQTWTASATFTSGAIGLVIRRRLAAIPISANGGFTALDALALSLPQVPNSACLEFVWHGSSSTGLYVMGELELING